MFAYNRSGMNEPIIISPQLARRIAVRAQRLDRLPAKPDKEQIIVAYSPVGLLADRSAQCCGAQPAVGVVEPAGWL